MLGNELDSLGRFAGFRAQQNRIRALGSPSVGQAFATCRAGAARRVMHLPVDLAVRMMKIGQLHHLHLRFRQRGRQVFGQLCRAARVSGSGQRHVWDLHHPSETGLLGPPHHQYGGQILQEYLPDQLRHPVGPRPAEVPIDDDHRDQDADRVHDEGEEEVLGY